MRLWAALRLATFAAAWDGREGGQRFVVSKGCPQALDADAEVRVFVAVPSAAGNFRRRQWIRSTWCRSQPISGASLAAAFFVGRLADEAAIRFEAATYGDVVQVPSWDGMDNVTAKQVHSFRYFASLHGDAIAAPGEDAAWADQRGPTFPTHYMRAEDDVYLNVGGILADLFKRRVDALPGPPRALRNGAELLWASMVTEGAAHPYPAGSAFVLSHRLARALAAAHRVSPYDVGASAPPHCDAAAPNATARCKPPHGKGGFTSDGAWSTDDAFVGRMLFAFAFETINDRRFHEPPGGGLTAFPVSRHSLAVAGLRAWGEFDAAHNGDFPKLNVGAEGDTLAHDASRPESTLWMEVDGRSVGVRFVRGCELVEETAFEVCATFRLDGRLCETVSAQLRGLCPYAAAHAAKFIDS